MTEIPDELKWMSHSQTDIRWLRLKPSGYRDIWWCPVISEPFILEYTQEGKPRCPNCESEIVVNDEHQFIVGILNPRKFLGSKDVV